MVIETRMRLLMFEEICLDSTRYLGITVKIAQTIASYRNLQIFVGYYAPCH